MRLGEDLLSFPAQHRSDHARRKLLLIRNNQAGQSPDSGAAYLAASNQGPPQPFYSFQLRHPQQRHGFLPRSAAHERHLAHPVSSPIGPRSSRACDKARPC